MIFVHELGHFIAAKALGVYAPRFSIGFGPALFRRRRGETEYVLAVLPLGGYVRMASRHDAETAFLEGGAEEQTARAASDPGYDPNAMIPFGPKPVPEDRWFESKPLWARIVIMIAGVVMNVAAGDRRRHHARLSLRTVGLSGDGDWRGVAPRRARLSWRSSRAATPSGRSMALAVRTWNDVRKAITSSVGSVAIATQRGEVRIPLGRDKGSADDIADGLVYYLAAGHRHSVSGRPRGTGWFSARGFHRQRRRSARALMERHGRTGGQVA